MNIKNKIKKWVISIVDSRIEDVVGKESKSSLSNSWYGYISSWFSSSNQADDSNGNTGVFRKIERLEEKINALEKYLKISYHIETKEIRSYQAEKKKSVKKSKRIQRGKSNIE